MEKQLGARLKALTPNVYPMLAPTKFAMPCVVFQRLNTETINNLDGINTKQSFVTIMLAISSPVYGEAKDLAQAILEDLSQWDDEDVRVRSWINQTEGVDNTKDTPIFRIEMFFDFIVNE